MTRKRRESEDPSPRWRAAPCPQPALAGSTPPCSPIYRRCNQTREASPPGTTHDRVRGGAEGGRTLSATGVLASASCRRSGLGLEERPVCGRDYSLGGCLELCCCVIYPCCSCLAVRTLRAPCLCLSKPRSLSHRLSKNSWCWGYPYPRPLPPALSIHPPRKPRAYV